MSYRNPGKTLKMATVPQPWREPRAWPARRRGARGTGSETRKVINNEDGYRNPSDNECFLPSQPYTAYYLIITNTSQNIGKSSTNTTVFKISQSAITSYRTPRLSTLIRNKAVVDRFLPYSYRTLPPTVPSPSTQRGSPPRGSSDGRCSRGPSSRPCPTPAGEGTLISVAQSHSSFIDVV